MFQLIPRAGGMAAVRLRAVAVEELGELSDLAMLSTATEAAGEIAMSI